MSKILGILFVMGLLTIQLVNGQNIVKESITSDSVLSDTSKVYLAVEQMPEYPGGFVEMMKYISQNLKYPAIDIEDGIESHFIVNFVVNEDGTISDIDVTKPINRKLKENCTELIKAMPKWTQGKQNGQKVKVRYTLPINIHLKK
ncbi:energy transducer TonB [Dysgonomonas sp. 520]|uniref:energy transducer TonB n=1 Tax=Dysgonomonas sp. 520 TaxID=2302931 RepID=UPI0013D5343F|nr:energy transducer TonB [Dysgonomonas sp. 520]